MGKSEAEQGTEAPEAAGSMEAEWETMGVFAEMLKAVGIKVIDAEDIRNHSLEQQ